MYRGPPLASSVVTGLVRGDDGVRRCAWGVNTPEYVAYHDEEWGRPVVDDTRLYEKLCLEGFQAGLSWLTILRKRENFRAAFEGFDADKVARFGPNDVVRLMEDAGIVRNRAKIEATIANARAIHAARDAYGSLAALLWTFEPRGRRAVPRELGDVPAATPESKAASKELLRLGFRFVGPTTVYAAMQACGIVDDHMSGCAARAACEAERKALVRPVPSRSPR
jgi:DNA-3-methyladenine glycosylase I